MKYVAPEDCDCYECAEPEYIYYENGHRAIKNNMKYHTFGKPCKRCGKPKSEYKDLGRKGYFTCWWCEKRAGDF